MNTKQTSNICAKTSANIKRATTTSPSHHRNIGKKDQHQMNVPNTNAVINAENTEKQQLLKNKKADTFKLKGNKLLERKKYRKAIVEYTNAIRLNPKNAIYYSNRAAAYTNLQHFQKAVIDARKSKEIDPNYVKAYMREAFAEYKSNHFQKAYNLYQNALQRLTFSDKDKKMRKQIQDQMKECETHLTKVAPKIQKRRHMSTAHKYRNSNPSAKQFICSYCNKQFICSYRDWEKHLRTHKPSSLLTFDFDA